MSEFIEHFKERGDISFIGMRETALSLLPKDKTILNRLYEELRRGKEVLDDEIHMNMYLRSFGQMHKAKMDAAFERLPKDMNVFDEEIEIYDWGCGQGLATICLLDYLRTNGTNHSFRSIHLVDPSSAAVDRAVGVLSCYDHNMMVKTTKKEFDDLVADDFPRSRVRKVHLFSNILDVEFFDLASFVSLFQKCFDGPNFFICVGPYYSNNKRVDEFVNAIIPDTMFATMTKDVGAWKNQWSISLRVFFKVLSRIEPVADIRKRIEEFHKKDQFFAGYVLDAVAETYSHSKMANEAETLYRSLSAFDVKSNRPLDGRTADTDSELAVLANIISRGLPTKAPLKMERLFTKIHRFSEEETKKGTISFPSKNNLQVSEIIDALHVIEPRFDVDYYNGDMLESPFETAFITQFLKGSGNEYLCQVLEPQRPLSSIVPIPYSRFTRDQRVDFALEIPYGDSQTGFIIELDGQPYHSSIFQRLRDKRRDKISSAGGYETFRIDQLNDTAFINTWNMETVTKRYLATIKRNHGKRIEGAWKNYLETVLAPVAVARVQRMLLEAAMSGALDINAKKWEILVVERDVPCAAISVDDLKDKLKNIYMLSGNARRLPDIDLTIVSTEEFKDSPLHLGKDVKSEIPKYKFDLCLDISMLLRDNIDALPLPVDADTVYIIRSSHYKKTDRTVCTAANIQYPPLVTRDSTGKFVSIESREKILEYFLQEIFRKQSFRTGQLPIISHALGDMTTIGLLPTGGGKSLTYQLSCLLQPGVAIVVDPIVSLMVDQLRGMNELRIDFCECMNSGMDAPLRAQKLSLLQNGMVQIMLLSPERFMMENFRSSLLTMTDKNCNRNLQ